MSFNFARYVHCTYITGWTIIRLSARSPCKTHYLKKYNTKMILLRFWHR